MQDNANPPIKGLASTIEREKQFMSGVEDGRGSTSLPQESATM